MLIISLIILSFYLFYVVFSPFVIPIVWALILAFVFYPFYRWLNRRLKGRRSRCALVMTAFVVLLIVFPAVYFLSMLAHEAISAYAFFENGLKTGRFQPILELKDHPIIQGLWQRLDQYVDLSDLDLNSLLLDNLKRVSVFAINQRKKLSVHEEGLL